MYKETVWWTHDFRKESSRKGVANNTYKSLLEAIFTNSRLRVERENVEGQARGLSASPAPSGSTILSVHWNDVSVSKPIPIHNIADSDQDSFPKHRAAHDDRVDFPVLSTRVAILGELRNQVP